MSSTARRDDRPNPFHLWEQDEDFGPLFEAITDRTLVDRPRCYILHRLALQARALDGDVAEIGVYKGGTALLLRRTLDGSGKSIHLFDTYAGMPETDASKDEHRAGDFDDTSLKSVQAFVGTGPDVTFYAGLFPDTARGLEDRRFALVHVDADICSSVRACCEFFYPRTVAGGIILFDDYGWLSCPGALEAVDEFFAQRDEVPLYLPTGQCLVRKL